MKQTKMTWVAALLIGLLPAVALADHRGYDRGDRYRGGHISHGRSRSGLSFSLGFGSSSWRGDYSYATIGYRNYHRPSYHRLRYHYSPPVYYSPPVVVYRPAPVYCPPPVVYSTPSYYSTSYYYSPPVTHHYSTARYYYGR